MKINFNELRLADMNMKHDVILLKIWTCNNFKKMTVIKIAQFH